jgi:hypothetical protein
VWLQSIHNGQGQFAQTWHDHQFLKSLDFANICPGFAEMSWYVASVVRMSEIMHIFQNFSSNPNFGCTHCIH